MTDIYLCANSDGKREAPEQLFQELDDSHQEKISGGINPNTTQTLIIDDRRKEACWRAKVFFIRNL
ncbi:hypothetical protein H6G96_26285 [Nostoc sp. FACHB-892]|uniref:hypothetical protein n=1 Tax=Nostoc sp. FACHB-892 TaxID=2692843 RepID=UPI0016824AF1|nr:hypothetical protein [Nostoc sp. FACHB-892]MBD2729729.1 hypothetical protein [Nostoc sp. FACHB-892]